ncbi:CIR protein, partial [Plasmodium chabaudi adami]
MGQPSDNLKDVYDDIFKINDYFYETEQGTLINNATPNDLIHKYCDYGSSSEKGNCQNDYLKMASSGVIHLLTNLKKYKLEDDKLAEYAILWLSYKLNEKPKNKLTDLNKFYTSYIEKNKCYNEKINGDGSTYKDIINRKKDLMSINEISKFNDPFGMLLSLYYLVHLNKLDCEKCSQNANEFVQNFEDLNKDSNDKENSSYNKLLSTLSNDYDNLKKIFKNKCPNLQPLPELNPKKSSGKDSVDISGKGDKQLLGDTFEVTSSSSSTLNTVIPVLSTFAIPVFLGVAYK